MENRERKKKKRETEKRRKNVPDGAAETLILLGVVVLQRDLQLHGLRELALKTQRKEMDEGKELEGSGGLRKRTVERGISEKEGRKPPKNSFYILFYCIDE